MARKLYVGNLPFTAGEAELQELFGTAGTVDTVKVMRDMATGRARGFAFVEMATDNAKHAFEEKTRLHIRFLLFRWGRGRGFCERRIHISC